MKYMTEKYGELFVLTECPTPNSVETFEFLTEVHENHDGSEDRYTLRDAPRQFLTYELKNSHKEFGSMFHELYAGLRKYWGVPLFHLYQEIPDTEGDIIEVDVSAYPVDLGIGFAFIKSSDGVQIVEIIALEKEIIVQEEIIDEETEEVIQEEIRDTLYGYVLSEEIDVQNAIICPLRVCIIQGDANIQSSGFGGSQTITFAVMPEDVQSFNAPAPTQYRGHDIYYKPLLRDDDFLDMTLSQNQVIIDGQIGSFQQYTHWEKPKYIKSFMTKWIDRDDANDFREFIYRRMGRLREFWLPLYEKHLNIVSTGNVTSSFTVDNEFVEDADRKYIAINRNGVWSAHQITAISEIDGFTNISFSPSIVATSAKSLDVCYLALHRFNTDSIEISFNGIMKQSAVSIVEVFDNAV